MRIVRVGSLLVFLQTASGCAVYMAANQPPQKNLAVLSPGTSRSLVIAELGYPISTKKNGDQRVDVFSFTQGYSKGAKVGRAFVHGVADVFTLGIWEVIGTPAEAVFNGDKIVIETTYDVDDKVQKVTALDRSGAARPTELSSGARPRSEPLSE
ncbi:hypothetical protein THSYN_13375 [Candidatus Thiodictyon syntrophicum]|uniref:Beta-barrel assembly machine subunit BamE n=2 Tax=Candidatus Thiodictyon syntrophicum TaxID=1166950 RepID=A0A2K8U8I5_9GAMM|nr:hypothetical protein THSYN_13375 [Candidatus Thiodictyon syntrophicum]